MYQCACFLPRNGCRHSWALFPYIVCTQRIQTAILKLPRTGHDGVSSKKTKWYAALIHHITSSGTGILTQASWAASDERRKRERPGCCPVNFYATSAIVVVVAPRLFQSRSNEKRQLLPPYATVTLSCGRCTPQDMAVSQNCARRLDYESWDYGCAPCRAMRQRIRWDAHL